MGRHYNPMTQPERPDVNWLEEMAQSLNHFDLFLCWCNLVSVAPQLEPSTKLGTPLTLVDYARPHTHNPVPRGRRPGLTRVRLRPQGPYCEKGLRSWRLARQIAWRVHVELRQYPR